MLQDQNMTENQNERSSVHKLMYVHLKYNVVVHVTSGNHQRKRGRKRSESHVFSTFNNYSFDIRA